MKKLVLVLALVPTTLWATGFAFTAVNRFPVVDIGNATFEVIARGGRVGARDYWCAAGDYGITRGIRSSTRVYVVKAEGPSASTPGRKAVQFTVDPQAAGIAPVQPQLSLTVKVPGDNMSLAAAQQYCGAAGILFF